MPIRRVLMTADGGGGVWTHTTDLAREFEARGIEVVLATMGPALTPAQRRLLKPLVRTTLRESTWPLEWMNEPWDGVDAAATWLLDLARETRPDIVHLSSMSHGALTWPAPSVVVTHSCVLSWWIAVRREPPPLALATYRQRVGQGVRKADIVLAPTSAMLSTVRRLYGVPRHSGVVPNGRPADRYQPADKLPFIFGAGRIWDAGKNLTALDRVAPVVSWPVRIAGDLSAPGGSSSPLRHAEWLGVLSSDEMAKTLARAAIYAHPARYEPFGLSVLEAALSGCTLVLGDIKSLRELWDHCAIFVPPDDDAALAEAMQSVIERPSLREQLAARSCARARQYTTARMAERYLDWYSMAHATRVA
jgi:glycogen(starch) synthase